MEKQTDLVGELKKYKVVIFDFDGTLAYPNIDWDCVKNKLSVFVNSDKKLNMQFSPLNKDIFFLKNKFGNEYFHKLLEILGKEELKDINPKINKKLVDYINQNKSQKIAIYSMNTKKCVDNFVKKNIKTKIHMIISKDNCIEPKPCGKNLLKIINKLHVSSREAVYLGNCMESDYLSAESAKIDFIKI